MSKISITSDNNAFFLLIIFVIFRVFNRKQRDYLKLCYLAMFVIVIFPLKFQINVGFPFNFTSLQKCSTNEFFNLETITSCHYIQYNININNININSLLPKIDELKCITNKIKAAIIGIAESKLDLTVPDLEVNLPAYDIL